MQPGLPSPSITNASTTAVRGGIAASRDEIGGDFPMSASAAILKEGHLIKLVWFWCFGVLVFWCFGFIGWDQKKN